MKREQMLHRLGINDEDFRDYLKKLSAFLNQLNPSQRKFHYEHLGKSTVTEIANSLGPDVTTTEIEHLFAECPPVEGICFIRCCHADEHDDD